MDLAAAKTRVELEWVLLMAVHSLFVAEYVNFYHWFYYFILKFSLFRK